MKKLTLALFVSVLSASATISNNIQFNVRPDGNDSNGGGFVTGATGTDFSQQAAAQYTFSDLASAGGTTNPCVVTSASHNFVAADVGNLINITAGTNWLTGAGIEYQIVSVAANAATLDRACGSAVNISGGTYFVGGAKLTLSGATTVADNTTSMSGGAAATAVINVKNGTYTLTSAVSIGSNTNIAYVGYNATFGDNGTAPTITTVTNSTNLFSGGGRSMTWDNFIFTNTAATPAVGLNITSGPFVGIRNSSFSGFTNGISSSAGMAVLIGVEIKNSTSNGFTSGPVVLVGSWIHNNTGDQVNSNYPIIINSIVSNGTAKGITTNGVPQGICVNSDIVNNGTIGWNQTSGGFALENCIIYGNGTFGVVGPGSALVTNSIPVNIGRNNGYGNNTSGDLSNYTATPGAMNGTTKALNDVAFTASPFTSATNFALNSTAGGGPVASTTGWPGNFPTSATSSTMNIGATQSSSSGGGGNGSGSVIYVK